MTGINHTGIKIGPSRRWALAQYGRWLLAHYKIQLSSVQIQHGHRHVVLLKKGKNRSHDSSEKSPISMKWTLVHLRLRRRAQHHAKHSTLVLIGDFAGSQEVAKHVEEARQVDWCGDGGGDLPTYRWRSDDWRRRTAATIQVTHSSSLTFPPSHQFFPLFPLEKVLCVGMMRGAALDLWWNFSYWVHGHVRKDWIHGIH